MKKVLGPMDSTEEYDVIVEEPDKKKKVKTDKKRTRDWSFFAIVISLIIILVPSIYMGVILWNAKQETDSPVIGHRFDNDLSPTIESESLPALKAKLEALDSVDKVSVELTTATVRIYLELPEGSEKRDYKEKALEAEAVLYESFSLEDYFTASDTQEQYDYEIYAHDALGEETIIYLLNKSSRMEVAKGQYLSEPVSQDMVDEIWAIQEELDNPTEVEDEVIEDAEESEDGE